MRTYTPQTSKKLIYQDNVALEYCNVVRKKKTGYFLGGVICRFRLFDANRPTFLNRPTSNKSSIQFLNSHDLDMRLFFWIRFLRI